MTIPPVQGKALAETKDFRVAIIGGGIAGLFCAVSLHKAGVPFDIFEATPQFSEVGAGISFGSNGWEAMRYLGFLDEYKETAYSLSGWTMLRAESPHEPLAKNTPKRGIGKISSIHRAQLLAILVKRLPPEYVHLGKRCIGVRRCAGPGLSYEITFTDGTTHTTNVIVGADGMRSVVRSAVLDYSVEPRYQGSQAFRSLFPGNIWKEIVGADLSASLLVYVGAGKHVVVYPIDGGQANLVAFSSDPRDVRFTPDNALSKTEPWVQPADYDHAISHFAEMGQHVQAALAAVDPERVTVWKIHLLWPPLPTYVRDGVALLGDAAHGMPPHCGQGAGQSLEDAYILGRVLGHPTTTLETVSESLRIYDEVRRPRGNKVLEFTLESGDVWESWGPSGDSVEGLKKDMTDRLNWIWDHDLEPDWERAKALLEGSL